MKILASIGASLLLTTVGIGLTSATAAENEALPKSERGDRGLFEAGVAALFCCLPAKMLIEQSKFG